MIDSRVSLEDWLARYDRRVGLVFTDVVGSTLLIYAKGTLNFAEMLGSHRSRATTLLREVGGRLVDQSADEIFAAFPSATKAFCFADELFRDPGHPKLRIRAGVHYGTVRAQGRALVGRNVHLAARVRQHAVDRELWVSEAARSALESESPSIASGISWITTDECELKGVPDKQRLWRAA